MKILLINPPFTSYGGLEGHGGKTPPINLGYLASYARSKRKDYEISIFDAEVLGATFGDIRDRITRQRPDVVGITSSTPAYTNALRISGICKEINNAIKVVMGGVHPSAFPTDTAKEASVDFVVFGEGEITFLELLAAIEKSGGYSGVDGVIFKDGGEVVRAKGRHLIENLDDLPFPARDLMPHGLYQPPPTKRVSAFKSTSLTSARGCPHRCNFCSANVIWGRRYRYRSAANVADEMEQCIKDFDIREFSFTDELFTLIPARAEGICAEIIKRNLNIAWVCMCRAGQVNADILKLMEKAGCKEISFGVESGDQRVLDIMCKDITLGKVRESIMLTKKAGIKTHASYMIGNLGEDRGSIRRTIDFAKELNTDIAAFFVATPLPGTMLYKEALSSGYIRSNAGWKDFSPLSKTSPVMNLPGLSSEELMGWQRRAIKEYYMRPAYVLKRIAGLKSRSDILNLYNGLKLFLRIENR